MVDDLEFFFALDTTYAWYRALERRASSLEILGHAACRVVIDWIWIFTEINEIVSGAFDMGNYSVAAMHPIQFLNREQRIALHESSFRPVYLNGVRSNSLFN